MHQNLVEEKTGTEKEGLSRQLTIVGRGECGKTSILRRFFKNEFHDMVNATPIESEELNFIIKNKNFKLKIWDTCGQEDFSRFRALTIPMSDYVIICFSVCDSGSFFEVEDTLAPMIKEKAKPNTKIILVATKIDLRDDNCITTEEGQVLAERIKALKYIECSSLTGFNISEIFEIIKEDMYQNVRSKDGFFSSLFNCCN